MNTGKLSVLQRRTPFPPDAGEATTQTHTDVSCSAFSNMSIFQKCTKSNRSRRVSYSAEMLPVCSELWEALQAKLH